MSDCSGSDCSGTGSWEEGRPGADLGSGEGTLTLALADLLGPAGTILSVDRDGRALGVQSRRLHDAFPGIGVTPLVADFATPLGLPSLDGIVMANSLHFERDRLAGPTSVTRPNWHACCGAAT